MARKNRWKYKGIMLYAAVWLILALTACGSTESAAETLQKEQPDTAGEDFINTEYFTESSTVGEVIRDQAFGDYGHLLFPVDLSISEDMTLKEVSSSSVYLWYSQIQPEKTVEILNDLKQQSLAGEQIFYSIYTEEEMEEDSSKRNTGLFFFRGEPGKEFAVTNAGGGSSWKRGLSAAAYRENRHPSGSGGYYAVYRVFGCFRNGCTYVCKRGGSGWDCGLENG